MRRYLARSSRSQPRRCRHIPVATQWQNLIFDAAAGLGMPDEPRSFAAIYLAFLGRDNGPRAGWLLASLDQDFVVRRLLEAADATPATIGGPA